MNSKEMRFDPLFMRNTFSGGGRWEIPFIKKQPLISDKIALIAYSDTRLHDLKENCQKGVHFFLDDYRFNVVYNQPRRVIQRLSQYTFLLTPDYSTYADMQPWRQLESVAHSRCTQPLVRCVLAKFGICCISYDNVEYSMQLLLLF